mmetsp:Transcript_3595/g.8832  ORF Transcript_3595/g.8832 Transcript_3595/m.8832 type:complete len:345 (-) Transcript_3595:74-1108(-)
MSTDTPPRAKRKSAQAAQDAQLARALQEEWMRGGKRKLEKSFMAEALSTSGVNDHRLLEDAVSEDQVLKHFIRRDPKGFLVADARRGCCVCEECAQRLADEIVSGSGLIVLRGAISLDIALQARMEIDKMKQQEEKSGKLVPAELGPTHRRIWALLNRGAPFTSLVTHSLLFKILSRILGEDFALGSFSANEIGPGCPQGPAHVDYPYSMLSSFPTDTMACQTIFCLDEWTEENGATRVQLHSHKQKQHPDRDDHLSTVIEGDMGDLVIYHSLLHHRSGQNVTEMSRVGLLGQFLAKYVRPMEDQVRGVKESIKKNASKQLRQLLAMDCPYPILDPSARMVSYD